MKRFWIINLILFQASWAAAAWYPQQAALIIACLLGIHFLCSPSPRFDSKVLLLALIGISADTILLLLGAFYSPMAFFPLWLVLLWFMFIISLNHCLHWLVNQPIGLLVCVGAFGGTLSYWAGIQAGALQTHWPITWVITSLMLTWSILLPLLIYGYRYLKLTSMGLSR